MRALSYARIGAACGGPCEERVCVLQEQIMELVATRQELRARGAGHSELEANRLALIELQQQLSLALIGQYTDLAHGRAAA